MKCLSVLGSELLDQVLQGSELSPVDEVELLQKKTFNGSNQGCHNIDDNSDI